MLVGVALALVAAGVGFAREQAVAGARPDDLPATAAVGAGDSVEGPAGPSSPRLDPEPPVSGLGPNRARPTTRK